MNARSALMLLALSAPLAPGVALALQPATPEKPPEPREVIFDTGEEVNGRAQNPGGDLTTTRTPARLDSLIEVRKSFQDKLLMSAELL